MWLGAAESEVKLKSKLGVRQYQLLCLTIAYLCNRT
jgi:hypothetical protein